MYNQTMKIIRTSTFTLKFSNTHKQSQLKLFMTEYLSVVNQFIDVLWNKQIFTGSFIKKDIQDKVKTWLSARTKQCAGKQALQIIKSQRKKKVKSKPEFKNNSIELDQRFVSFLDIDKSFDEFVKFSSLGNKIIVVCPIKYHKHYNNLISNGFTRSKSVRLREYNNNLYLDVFLEKEYINIHSNKTIGIDIGIKKLMVDSNGNMYGRDIEKYMNKIQRKQQGSKSFKRALKERDDYINKTVKELPLSNYILENIKNIKKDTKKKKRLSKEFRSKFQRWTYRSLLRRIHLKSEVDGVHCQIIDPSYTSQTCSVCKFVHKSNRNGEIFLCKNCGYTLDADLNASKNILNLGLTQEFMVPERK